VFIFVRKNFELPAYFAHLALRNCHVVPALNQNIGCSKFINVNKNGTVVTRLEMTQGMDLYEREEAIPLP
jgi:hypothetical protein